MVHFEGDSMFDIGRLRVRKEVHKEREKVLSYQRKEKINLIPDRNWILSVVLPHQALRILDIGPCPFVFDFLIESERRKLYEYHTMDYPAKNGAARANTIAHIHNADLPGYPFEDAYFDVVIAADVIEHIKENGVFLKEIHRILKPEGELFLTTPNYGSIAAIKRVLFGRMMHDPLGSDLERYCFYDHVRYFTTVDLMRYLRNNRLFPNTLVVTGLITDRGYPFRSFPWNLLMKYVYNALPRIHYRFAHQTTLIAAKNETPVDMIYVH